MKRAGIAGLLLLALAPAARADVSVRVEGQSATLLPRTTVAQSSAADPRTGCPGTSAAAAIEAGTKGDWDGQPYTQTVLGETHAFADSDYWALWVFRGGRFVVANGACDETLAPGEELLVGYERAPAPDYTPLVYPLWLTGVPATATRGVPFTVTVNRAACETAYCLPGEGHRVPGAGATVTAGGMTATADGNGQATLTLTDTGPNTVRATAAGANPCAAVAVTVSDPPVNDVPATPAPTPPAADAPDTRAPYSSIRGIGEQQRFTRKRAPRTLRAVVDETALSAVTLGLTRQRGRRCWAFSDIRGRFVRTRCGRHPRFRVGSDPVVSYLLPKRLRKGRYVLDVVATDVAGNAERLARGRNRVVFRVR